MTSAALSVGRASRLYLVRVRLQKVNFGSRGFAARAEKAAPPDLARKLLDEGSHKYLDVRTPEEYKAGHVDGATNIPLMLNVGHTMTHNDDFLAQVQTKIPQKETPLVVGCKSGKRSAAAIEKLSAAGYTDLTNLTGGYDAWIGHGKR